MSDYNAQREANIARNKALLESLGLDKPFFTPKEVGNKAAPAKTKPAAKKKANPRKRKAETPVSGPEDSGTANDEDEEDMRPATKVARTAVVETPSGVRRSGRNAGKNVDYNSESMERVSVSAAVKSGLRLKDDAPALQKTKRVHDPKTYGSIPGAEVGTWWQTREACSKDAIHAPWVAGIAPGKNGAFSVALSGGYDDDVDLGLAFTYTGSGGRDLKGTKNAPKNLRTAPQSSDQSFENHFNKALQKSCKTKHPIRVIRGFKLRSKFAPAEGYRYDGLYRVEKAWLEEGLNPGKFKVCKFAFKRIKGQPPLPEKDIDIEEDGEEDVEMTGDESEAGASSSQTNVLPSKEEADEMSVNGKVGESLSTSVVLEPSIPDEAMEATDDRDAKMAAGVSSDIEVKANDEPEISKEASMLVDAKDASIDTSGVPISEQTATEIAIAVSETEAAATTSTASLGAPKATELSTVGAASVPEGTESKIEPQIVASLDTDAIAGLIVEEAASVVVLGKNDLFSEI